MRKIVSIICILSLFFTSAVPAFAWDLQGRNNSSLVSGETLQVNPYYEEAIGQERLETELDAVQQYASQSVADDYCTTKSEVSEVIREAMVHRENNISVQYVNATPLTKADLTTMMDSALAETNQPNEGDYLAFQYGGWKGSYKGYNYFGTYYLTVTYTITYYTTLEQEKELDAAVEDVLLELNIDEDADDYEKVSAIYDYICNHVTYDYDHLYHDDYKLQFTAYAALINGTSVCQGYANLFYRMAKELGLSTRIIRGWQTSTGGGHAWNIVKLGDLYYNLDTTWDAVYADAGLNYAFFLKGYNPFDDHTFRDEYLSDAFMTSYPMADKAYIVCNHRWDDGKVIKEATCKSEGEMLFTCKNSECDETKTEPIARLTTHSYDAATCTTAKTCKVCGVTSGFKLGHSYSSQYTVDKKATATAAGSMSQHCTRSGCDAVRREMTIAIPSMKLSGTNLTYDGKQRNPYPIITGQDGEKLKKGTDYTVTYESGRTKVGRYKVTVKFCSDQKYYSGTKTFYFNILPKAPSTVTAKLYGHDDVKISWSKSTGASGYYVYYKKSTSSGYTQLTRTTLTSAKIDNLTDGAYYYFKVVPYFRSGDTRYQSTQYKTDGIYTLKKIETPSAAKSSTKVKISWKKISGATGYHVRQYQKKNGEYVTLDGYYTVDSSKLFTAAKNKTRYYRVRAYKTVDGEKIFGPWSDMKAYTRQ